MIRQNAIHSLCTEYTCGGFASFHVRWRRLVEFTDVRHPAENLNFTD